MPLRGETVTAASKSRPVEAISLGDVGKLPAEGLETTAKYSVGELRELATYGRIRDFKSRGSKAEQRYGVMVRPDANVGDDACHAVWARYNGETPPRSKWRLITLVRNKQGKIRIVPGWV